MKKCATISTKNTDTGSIFYPPRAGPTHGFYSAWFGWRRRRAACGLAHFSKFPEPRLLPILLVPCYGFAVRGNPAVALIALVIWGVMGLVVLVFLGQTPATVATAQLVGIHATGTVCALHRDIFLSTRLHRLQTCFAAVLGVVLLVYFPAFWVVRSVAFPLHIRQEPVIVNGLTFTSSLQRGDIVGYRIRRIGGLGPVRVNAGYGLDPVLALPGDRVVFFRDFIEVNGKRMPRRSLMPTSGELVIPDGHWFIRPSFGGNFGGQPERAASLMERAAVVPRSDIIGKPFSRWFWREQSYEQVQ